MRFARLKRNDGDTAAKAKSKPAQARGALRIGEPNGAFEQEADRVADEIMTGGAAKRHWSIASTNLSAGLQRKCSCGSGAASGQCEECKKKEEEGTMRRKAAGPAAAAYAPPIVHEVLNSPGQPLDRETRNFFEPRLGEDLSGVRVHTDARAAGSAASVHAEAYTVGSDIAFGTGRFAPQTVAGRRLLAHELTHTLQQGPNGRAAVQRQPKTTPGALDPDDQKVVDAAQREAANFKCNVTPVLWGIIHKHFPNDGRKIAGTGCETALPGLRTEFSATDAKDSTVKRSVPMLYAGKAFIESTDAARFNDRVADLGKQIEAIDDWRLANFLIDDKDLTNPRITGQLRSMSNSQLVDYKQKNKNADVQRYAENLLTFTTPTQAGATVDPLSNEMSMFINGVTVVVKPDDRQVSGVKGGETSAKLILDPPNIPAFNWDANGKITGFPGYTPTARLEILTQYGPGASPEATSGYGRGTTTEDVKNKATALRFHEGTHGEDFIEFVRNNKVPVFTGANGMSKDDFQTATKDFLTALDKWRKSIDKGSKDKTDCVGATTIDQFNKGEKGYQNICP